MKDFYVYYQPIRNGWQAIPAEPPLIHKGLLALCAVATLTFFLGISPLGILILPLFIYLVVQGLWKRLFFIFLITLVVAGLTLIGKFIGTHVSDVFKNNPDAWWSNIAVKIIVSIIFIHIFLGLMMYPFGLGASLLSWDEIVETKERKLDRKGYVKKASSWGAQKNQRFLEQAQNFHPKIEEIFA